MGFMYSTTLVVKGKLMVVTAFLYFFVLQEGSTCVHIAAMKGSVLVMTELLKFNPSGITTARNKVTIALFHFLESLVKNSL